VFEDAKIDAGGGPRTEFEEVITGAVLLLAAGMDAISRRRAVLTP
jgi:hypothetical protein